MLQSSRLIGTYAAVALVTGLLSGCSSLAEGVTRAC